MEVLLDEVRRTAVTAVASEPACLDGEDLLRRHPSVRELILIDSIRVASDTLRIHAVALKRGQSQRELVVFPLGAGRWSLTLSRFVVE